MNNIKLDKTEDYIVNHNYLTKISTFDDQLILHEKLRVLMIRKKHSQTDGVFSDVFQLSPV